jgi:polyisoprenoid-binding protein YceI
MSQPPRVHAESVVRVQQARGESWTPRLVSGLGAASLVASLVGLLASPALADDRPSWRVVQGDVRVTCPLTVGGSFEAKTSTLTGALAFASLHPAVFTGNLAVDLKTLDTGIGLRNEHLQEKYLEVGKGEGFDKAVLSDIHLADADPDTVQARTTFTGTLLLHGARTTVTGKAEIQRQGSSVRVEASFPVTLADYGIPKPQYLGVGVDQRVHVKVSLVVAPDTTPAGGGR